MRHSQATDVLYYKIFSITINIDIIRKTEQRKSSFYETTNTHTHTHNLFFVMKQ